MKKLNTYLLALLASMFTLSSCEDSPTTDFTSDGYDYDFTQVLEVYTDSVILPTYGDMKNKAWKLYDAVQTFSTSRTQTNLNAVCAAWRATRIPWEQSESCLYGPAEVLDLDPSLDSWPLKKGDIDKIIEAGGITADKIMDPGVHGFHTIEYLIFSSGEPRNVTTNALSETEVEYLKVATTYLRDDCIKLWAAWNGANKIGVTDQAVINTFENFNPADYNFAYNFKNAITSSGVDLVTMDDAVDNIIEGCSGIADEVGSQKIGAPRDLALSGDTATAVLEVESWYSWNSIDDYANNIVSIRNSYFGGIGKTAANKHEHSLSTFVASKNAALDSEITAAIEKAYSAITSMQRPFRTYLTGTKVDAAINACTDLQLSLDKIKSLRD